MEQSRLNQERVYFRDFEVIELIGEGSFGKVFKVRQINTDIVYAMKAMRKQTLVVNNQIKYAVSES